MNEKQFVLIGGQKGGVGKTLVSALVIGLMRARAGGSVAAYDADGSLGGLYRHCGLRTSDGNLIPEQDPAVGIGIYNLHDPKDRDILLNSLTDGHDIVVHDCAGGSFDDILATVDASSGRLDTLLEAVELSGYRLTLLHLVTIDPASWYALKCWLELTDGFDVRHVAVVNAHFGGEKAYEGWAATETRARLLARGGKEIPLPAFPVPVLDKLKSLRIPYEAAEVAGSLTLVERSNFRRCKRQFDSAITPVLELLGVSE